MAGVMPQGSGLGSMACDTNVNGLIQVQGWYEHCGVVDSKDTPASRSIGKLGRVLAGVQS